MASVSKRKWTHAGVQNIAWVVRYTDQGGKKRLKTFASKKDADRYRTKVETEIERGHHVADAASITVRQAGDKWLDECENRMRLNDGMTRASYEAYRGLTRNHVYPYLGAKKLSELTGPLVQEWIYNLAQHPTEPRSKALMIYVLCCLRCLLTTAQRNGYIAHNVVKDARPRIPGRDPPRVAIPTKAELKMMIEEASGSMRPILYTAVFTGMRQGEIRALTWEHVDFGEAIIRVRHNADRWGKFVPPKSKAGVRDIPMAPALVSVLREWKLASQINDLGLVFPSSRGNVLTPINLHVYRWRPFMRRVGLARDDGLPKYHFHALRHCAASLLIEQGLPPKQIQTIMGHGQISMTFDRYGHLFEDAEPAHAAMAAVERDLLG